MSILEEIKVNRTPTHMVRPAALELQKKTKVIMGEYVEREKQPGEVKGAGSMDAYALPSKGNRT